MSVFGHYLNQNVTTTDANMFSTGEVCIVPPAPVNDPDAALMAEIETGSILLDLDMMQAQQRQTLPQSSSPSLTGFGYPPSPDTGLSFYPEQYPYHPAQPASCSMQQQGEISDIDENDMVRLLMREMVPDILADCQKLNLHPNLYTWAPDQVQSWIGRIVTRFELGDVDLAMFNFTGGVLASLTDSQFRSLAPKCGDILFSVVYILKSSMPAEPFQAPQVVPQAHMGMQTVPQMPVELQTGVPTTFTAQPRYAAAPLASPVAPEEHMYDSGSTGSPSDDECSVQSPAPSGPNTSMTPNHTGGIQLWQFLKELLLQPNSYSYCIRWLNRDEGIFKIEDSVEVARLWGLRKNRPAMNYDKLSRSIRQYYRKGIMKKTEVSQRLVYQFVHPC